MDLVITGAAGFLGSHVLFKWLCHYPNGRALCLVRGTDRELPRERILNALAQAAYECDVDIQPQELIDRVTVIDADLTGAAWRETPAFLDWIAHSAGFEVIHGAANLSFREEDREPVWQTNVAGTANFFQALQGLRGFRCFNYISTAYVAGSREGEIAEALADRPVSFNNVYEESKWAAERMVSNLAALSGIDYRIFRPSIIIGHSKTHRISSKTGFYKVVETLMQLGKLRPSQVDTIAIPINRNAGLNLIPIDFVVLEMMDIVAVGAGSVGKIFHLTNERPISLADLFFGVSPLTGVHLACGEAYSDNPANQMEALINRGLRHYMPYFRYTRNFDRRNVHAAGAARHQQEYWLDLMRLREFVHVFIAEERSQETQLIKVSA